jgi:hypothetical protein
VKLRFSIHDLLWLTALCVVIAAWWIDQHKLKVDAEMWEFLDKAQVEDKPLSTFWGDSKESRRYWREMSSKAISQR